MSLQLPREVSHVCIWMVLVKSCNQASVSLQKMLRIQYLLVVPVYLLLWIACPIVFRRIHTTYQRCNVCYSFLKLPDGNLTKVNPFYRLNYSIGQEYSFNQWFLSLPSAGCVIESYGYLISIPNHPFCTNFRVKSNRKTILVQRI